MRHQYGISVAEAKTVPPRETSSPAKSKEKRMFSHAIVLAIFAIFVPQSFHTARKILVTFAIFAKFAISSILF